MDHSKSEMVRDLSVAALKSAPPVTMWALTLNEWVAVATIAYIVLQAGYLVWKWGRERRRAREIDRLMAGPVAQPGEKAPRDG